MQAASCHTAQSGLSCLRLTLLSKTWRSMQDHINDVWANAGAIVTAAVASRMRQLWWTDPAGGILISALIIYRWSVITASSVAKVVSRLACSCMCGSWAASEAQAVLLQVTAACNC